MLTNSVYSASAPSAPLAQNKKQVTLTAILEDQGDPGRWKFLFQPAMQELRARHPAIDIQLNYTTHPYNQASTHILTDTHISKLKQR